MRQIYPVQGPELPVVSAATAGPLPPAIAELARLYQTGAGQQNEPGPWIRANMISSIDGAATVQGRSGGLSGPADRMVFGLLRSLADVILVGAGTARAERYRQVRASDIWAALRPAGGTPVPAIAVVTASLNLDPAGPLFGDGAPARQAGHKQPILITTANAAADRRQALTGLATIIEAGRDRVELAVAVAALADLGFRAILAEGGPSLLGEIAASGLLAELCLTVSPVLAAGTAGRIASSGPATQPTDLSLAHVLADAGYLLCRYLRSAS